MDLWRLLLLRNRYARTRLDARSRLLSFPALFTYREPFLTSIIKGENCEQPLESPRIPENQRSRRRRRHVSDISGSTSCEVSARFHQIVRLRASGGETYRRQT